MFDKAELNSNEKLALLTTGMEGEGQHFVMNGESADKILHKEKQAKFNDEVAAMENKFEKHHQLITEYAEKLSEDLQGLEIMPMFNYALIKPFEHNPFQQIKTTASGIITDLGGMNIGYKSNETGEWEENEQFIKVGTVIEVGHKCEFLKEGDIVFYTTASECIVPFYKMGFVVVAEQRILAVVNEKLTERRNNYGR
jgi:hypothetical protein